MTHETPALDPSSGSENELQLPAHAGGALDDRPSPARQFAFTALGGVGFSVFAASQSWIRRLVTTPTGLVLTFFITLAVLTVAWLVVLSFRTLDRRRLTRRFPGTLVFSFRQTSEVVNGLRQLGAFEPGRRDFELGSVEVVANLGGLTFWQRNPPEKYASLPWSKVDDVQFGRQIRAQGGRPEATVDVHVRSEDDSVQVSLFGVDASALPLPTRREVEWVQRQLANLFRGRASPASDPKMPT